MRQWRGRERVERVSEWGGVSGQRVRVEGETVERVRERRERVGGRTVSGERGRVESEGE